MSQITKWSIQDIRRANKKGGGHFFDPGTMKSFFSRLLKNSVYEGEQGIFFIIENRREEEHPPHYAIRKFNPETGSIDYPRHPLEETIKHLNSYGVKSRGFSDFNSAKAARRYANRLSYGGELGAQILFKQTGCIMDGANGDEYNMKRVVEIAIEQGYTGDVAFDSADEFAFDLEDDIIQWLSENCCDEHLYLVFDGGDLQCRHEEVDYDDPSKDEEQQLEEWRASGSDLGDIDFAEEIKEEATTNCALAGPDCDGRLWRCATCEKRYCPDEHGTVTEKGTNVECEACESARMKAVNEDGQSQDDAEEFIVRWSAEGYGVAHVRYVNDPDDLTKVADTIVLQPYAEASEFAGQELTIQGADARLPDSTWLVLHSGSLEELWQDQQKDQGRTK